MLRRRHASHAQRKRANVVAECRDASVLGVSDDEDDVANAEPYSGVPGSTIAQHERQHNLKMETGDIQPTWLPRTDAVERVLRTGDAANSMLSGPSQPQLWLNIRNSLHPRTLSSGPGAISP